MLVTSLSSNGIVSNLQKNSCKKEDGERHASQPTALDASQRSARKAAGAERRATDSEQLQEMAAEQTPQRNKWGRYIQWSDEEWELLEQLVAEDEQIQQFMTKSIFSHAILLHNFHYNITRFNNSIAFLHSINSTLCDYNRVFSTKGRRLTGKQVELWQRISDRVNLKFRYQRSPLACMEKWQKMNEEKQKEKSGGVAKMNAPVEHKKNLQMGHVNDMESSASKALTTGSANGHTSTSEGHSSDAHEGHENDVLVEAKAEGSVGATQQSRTDLKIEFLDG